MPRTCLRVCAAILLIAALSSASPAAESPDHVPADAAYTRAMAQALQALDTGDIDAARKHLESTPAGQRGFEFDYLHARAAQSPDASPAPDLITTIANPEVETRYAILNEHTRELVFICRDGSLVIHDLTSLDAPPRTVKHPGGSAVWRGDFSGDGKTFFSGHENGDVLVWNTQNWETKQTVSLGAGWPVRELAASPDGLAFVGESQSALELWSLAGDEPVKVAVVGERYNFGEGLAFSPQGDRIATGGMFDVILLDAKTGQQQAALSHASYTMGLEFSPDGTHIASAPRGNVNRFLSVFNVEQQASLFDAGPFDNYVVGLAFTPDGRRIAAGGCENKLRIFDAHSGEVVLDLPRPNCTSEPAFTRDALLLGWSEPDGFHFIELRDDKPAVTD
jgi:WD40 repeat protein